MPDINKLRRAILRSPAVTKIIRDSLKSNSLEVNEPVNEAFNRIREKVEAHISDEVVEHLGDTMGVLRELGYITEREVAKEIGLQEAK